MNTDNRFHIVLAPDEGGLVRKVNALLAQGWELSGGPYTREGNLCQALTRGAQIGLKPGEVALREPKRR